METSTIDGNENISIWHLPKIAWACAILLGINLIIAASIAISPELKVDIYGAAAGDVVLANTKPSAFVEAEQKPKPVRQAMKLTPVVELVPEAAVEETVMDLPRMSASLAPSNTTPVN